MYSLFDAAEKKNCTVAFLLTGKHAPITSLEMTLANTFHLVTKRFERQQNRGKKK